MSYPLTPPNPEKARAEHAALLEVERAVRTRRDKCRAGWGSWACDEPCGLFDECAALDALDEVRGQAHNGVKEGK